MQEIDGAIKFESYSDLQDFFEWSKGFTMTEEDVEQGLQGVDGEQIGYPIELEISLTAETVKRLAMKDAKKTAQLKQKVQ